MAGGRPSKFSDEIMEGIELMARRGFTDAEMATVLLVTEQTFNNWKKNHPEFFESLKNWKVEADEKVVRSLYERATGYSHPETKVFTHVIDGKVVITKVEVTKHYPPDVTADIFWSKNRQPAEWRDRAHLDITKKNEITAITSDMTPNEAAAQYREMVKEAGH